jgi:hypothetical protein
MASRLVSEDDLVSAARSGRLDVGFGSKLRAATKVMTEPRLIRTLAMMQRRMEMARRLYSEYPEGPDGLPSWRGRVQRLFEGP